MKKHLYWEDAVRQLQKEFPFTCHVVADDYRYVTAAENILGIDGVVTCRMGLPIDEDYAHSSCRGFGDLHFDIYARNSALLGQCITLLAEKADQQERSSTNPMAA